MKMMRKMMMTKKMIIKCDSSDANYGGITTEDLVVDALYSSFLRKKLHFPQVDRISLSYIPRENIQF